MSTSRKPSILFLTAEFKGSEMIQAVKAEDCFTLLLTEEKNRDEPWSFDDIGEVFYLPDFANHQDIIYTVSYLCRGRDIDYLVPIDEFEGEVVGTLREHLRLPGMGVSALRNFRDKLTMRELAQVANIPVPKFVQIKNYDRIREFMAEVPPPWVLKPRSEASAMGIQKIHEAEQLWRSLDDLGDAQSYYLLEEFVPGEVFHVDSIVVDGEIRFASPQKYGAPPMSVYQGGGVFSSRVLSPDHADVPDLLDANQRVLETLGMQYGVNHTEFIKAHADGTLYFLECAARVGGAHLADLVEAGTGVNLWKEWGRMVVAQIRNETYRLPTTHKRGAGLLITLARQEHPDLSAYQDKEIVWRANKPYHAGVIVASPDYDRVDELLATYTDRFAEDFMAVADPMGTQRTGRSG